MSSKKSLGLRAWALTTAGVAAISSPAYAQAARPYDIPAQPLSAALEAFGKQSGLEILFDRSQTVGKASSAVRGRFTASEALSRLITGTGLSFQQANASTFVVSVGGAEGGSPAKPQAVAEVVVTGSLIPGARTASPVQAYSAPDLRRQGVASAPDILSRIPANQGGDYSPESSGLGQGGGVTRNSNNRNRSTAPNLHGLGAPATLTVVNGHRLPVGSNGYAVDISLIPFAAIERVEVLTDGASSTYGADAIAGVINLITRKRADRFETSARYAEASGGFSQTQLSQTGGATWGSGSLFGAYQYDRQTALSSLERSPTASMDRTLLIYPSETQHAGYLSLQQELSAQTDLGVTALYSRRMIGDTVQTLANLSSRSESDTEQDILGAELLHRFGANWRATAYLQAAHAFAKPRLAQGAREEDLAVPLSDLAFSGREFNAEASLAGDLITLPAGALKVAFGGSFRKEQRQVAGPLIAADGLKAYDRSREVASAYAEADVPLISPEMGVLLARELELQAAVRYDRYSDFGETTNPKVGVIWSPLDGVRLRGTYSTSYRAPSLYDLYGQTNATFYRFGLSSSYPGGRDVILSINGNPLPLRPETAKNATFGFDLTPSWAPGLRISATYFKVDFKDRLVLPNQAVANIFNLDLPDTQPFVTYNPTQAQVLAILALGTGNANVVGRPVGPADVRAIVDNRQVNLASLKVEGADLDIAWSFDTGLGRVTVGDVSSFTFRYDAQSRPGGVVSVLADNSFYPPAFRTRLRLELARDTTHAGVVVNYREGLKDRRFAAPLHQASFTTLDAYASWAPPLEGPLKDVTFDLTVTNLADRMPPYSRPTSSSFPAYDSTNGSVLGRLVQIRVSKAW